MVYLTFFRQLESLYTWNKLMKHLKISSLTLITSNYLTFSNSNSISFANTDSVGIKFQQTDNKANDDKFSIKELIKRGTNKFKLGMFQSSIDDFNQVISLNKRIEPYLWQRGLVLYFNENFNECAKQFENDLKVNPQDTEEIIWNYICKFDQKENNKKLLVMNVDLDRRPFMRKIYRLFDDQNNNNIEDIIRMDSNNQLSFFYSRLYLSLYYQTNNDNNNAMKYINEALNCPYVVNNNQDLMVNVAVFFKNKLIKIQ